MDALSLFGLAAVSAMLVCYALEERAPGWTLGFAAACAAGSIYGFLQGAWPFGVVEAIWALVALGRWRRLARERRNFAAGEGSTSPAERRRLPERPPRIS